MKRADSNINVSTLLIETLNNIWQNYLLTGHDNEAKLHWLWLYMFYSKFVDNNILQSEELSCPYFSYIHQIPEEICSFFLETIFEIISKSGVTLTQLQDNEIESLSSRNSPSATNYLRKNHNFSQVILSTPNDCNKIISLRNFLTHQLGQHLLVFLLNVDSKLIASQKSLCNLCIYLYPNCQWDSESVEIQAPLPIWEIIEGFKQCKTHASKNVLRTKATTKPQKTQTIYCNKLPIHNIDIVEAFENFKNSIITSDELAYLLIQMLLKCVSNEHETKLNEQSMSIISLNFALDKLCGEDTTYSSLKNAISIKFSLLLLITRCLSNILLDAANIQLVKLADIFSKLAVALKNNNDYASVDIGTIEKNFHKKADLLSAINYVNFSGLQNFLKVNLARVKNHGNQNDFNNLKIFNENSVEISIETFIEILEYSRSAEELEACAETHILLDNTFKTFIKIIDQLCIYDCLTYNSTSMYFGIGYKKSHTRSANHRQTHCHKDPHSNSCFFQGILLKLLPKVSSDLQEYAIRYLINAGTCCCHYTLSTYETFLNIILNISTQYQKHAYIFLYQNVLSTIFLCVSGMSDERPSCIKCIAKRKSVDFQEGILQLYKQFYQQIAVNVTDLSNNTLSALLLLLKHFKSISPALTNVITVNVLADIVWPTFRQFRTHLIKYKKVDLDNQKNTSNNKEEDKHNINPDNNINLPRRATLMPSMERTKLHINLQTINQNDSQSYKIVSYCLKILNECLNIFGVYLNSDIRLVKAFYNEENIKHLEDLLSEPELVRNVCDLIKIGIDNLTFLGDNPQEQMALSEHLITFQLTSSDNVAVSLNSILNRLNKFAGGIHQASWLSNKHRIKSTVKLENLPSSNILYIATLQWCLNYELLKTSQIFYNNFAKMYSISNETTFCEENNICDTNLSTSSNSNCEQHCKRTIDDILKLNYNALHSFFLLSTGKSHIQYNPLETTENVDYIKTNLVNLHIDKENDCLSESLESFLTSIELTKASQSFSSISSSITSAAHTTVTENVSLEIAGDSYESVTKCYSNDDNQSFLQTLHGKKEKIANLALTESIIIFDIRNQSHERKYATSRLTAADSKGAAALNCTNHILPSSSAAHTSGIQVYPNIFDKLLSIVGGFFTGNRSNSAIDFNCTQQEFIIDQELQCLFASSVDCKKYLIKLFESTMAICIKGFQNEEVTKLEEHLNSLKAIILNHANAHWQQFSEDHSRENAVIKILQILLKIADLSNSVKDPAAVFNSNVVSPIVSLENLNPTSRLRAGSFNSTQHVQSDIATKKPPKKRLRRPVSGVYSDAKPYSTHASSMAYDSEIELSENNNDDVYLTADEGYDADGEIPEFSDSEAEMETAEFWASFKPTSRYRTQVLHQGLCSLVVEILIELCKKCIHNPLGWSDSLAQLANRLFVIREYIGDSQLLLRGFAPVLQSNDSRLRDLQQAILELIPDLNTPEILCSYFNILATKNPPTDILIKYLNFIGNNSIKKPQPSVEMVFPVAIDGKCISSVDPSLTDEINRIRNYHLHSQATTPFTRSPCIIPFTNTKLWNNNGFTMSLWLQMKGLQNDKSTSQFLEDDAHCSNDECMKTHIISIGTNQVMLSVYVNNNMNLVLESFKPNAEINSPNCDNIQESNILPGLNTEHTKANIALQDISSTSNFSTFRVALKQTKTVILNSFNNMPIFHKHDDNQSYSYTSVDIKSFRLPKNKWTHCMFSVGMNQDSLTITAYINGIEQQKLTLQIRNVRNIFRTHVFQAVMLGDIIPIKLSNNPNFHTESHTTMDGYPAVFSISNIFLFNRKLMNSETVQSLTAMGPDFSDLDHFQVGSWKPNYGYLAINKLHNPDFGNFAESIKLLCNSRILRFTAKSPTSVMCYDKNAELDVMCGRPYGFILYGNLSQNHLKSLQTATQLCGGLSTLLYLFARVIEITNNTISQYMALDLLLNVALSDTQLYTEFLRDNYISLIGYVIKTERCTKDVNLLKSIVNNACSQPLIEKKGETVHISENTTASVIYPQLITSVLRRYSDWHRSGAEHSEILDTLFSCILALTREKHPHKDFNLEQFNRAGLLKELLNLCKIYVIESPNPVFISKTAAESFISILSVFTGSPPQPSLLDEMMKLILLLHKPSECYVTHDRSKFYFLLTSQPPIKEKSTSGTGLNRVTASFRRNFKREYVSSELVENHSNRTRVPKKLIFPSSPYRRALHELEENLESVTNCERLNKSALRSLHPNEILNWRAKLKLRTISILTSFLHKNQPAKRSKGEKCNKVSNLQIIVHKRIRSDSLPSARSALSLRRTYRNTSLHTTLPTLNLGYSGTTLLNDTFGSMNSQRRCKSIVKTDFYNTIGIITLQEGLFTLLRNLLCLLPDNSVEEVLKHYIKIELLLVLSNNSSCGVRTAIIKLLTVLSKRLAPNDILMCKKSFYPQHLANQMSIYPTDVNMFEACLEWVTGVYAESNDCDNNTLRIREEFGLNTLFAILTNVNDQHIYLEKSFRIIKQIYKTEEETQILIDAGLIQTSLKALYNLYKKSNVINLKSESAILELLKTIGEKSLKSVGHMNIIWDILSMIASYCERQHAVIIKRFRSLQCQLQIGWIRLFLGQQNDSSTFKVISIPDSGLSPTETKMRLDLLIDYSTQFFTNFDASYTPSAAEIQLFELLITYSISTGHRCDNFIAWGLQPSRPRELRSFVVNTIWNSCQNERLSSRICDGKMIKSFLWLCLLEDLEQPLENLERLCKFLGISENDSTWNLENELERIEFDRFTMSVKQKTNSDKIIYRLEPLAHNCIESSMLITRRVTELQNAERKIVINQLKEYDEATLYTKWSEIVRRMTHEGAPWYSKERTENSWELDDTEGPSRVHVRLRRCHLDIDKRFLMQDYNSASDIDGETEINSNSDSTYCKEYSRPLQYLFSSYDQQLNISLNSQVIYNFPAKYLPVDGEIDGEIIVTDHKLYFMATYHCRYFYISCDILSITEIWLKRYQHQEKAFEIFLDTNKSLFFSLQNQEDWKIMCDVFCDKIVTPPDQAKILIITQQWREGLLTNWEYLMTLNQFAGRTYNDLMQYPVFPWVLSDYKTDLLDLRDTANFRILEKPIAVQYKENEQHYINNYKYINNTMTSMGSIILKPYHYSSHYSNSGTVLHFLVRVPPFTSYFLRYQDNNFDLPDRTFHSLNTTWNLASRDSPTDVKELIPEFFCLPEMFENFEHFNFGFRQNGERVEDVKLPPWCLRDARLFVLIHRQALEAEVTRSNLHHWIDLIFGYKQTGESAVDAINVFHPATYAAFQKSAIVDPIERKAVETMIKTYGQMPRQLFNIGHPQSKTLDYCLCDKEILTSVRGLRWGVYVGSPQLQTPTLGNIYKLPGAEHLISFNNANIIYGLQPKTCIMQGTEFDVYHLISWGHEDHIVRISPLNKLHSKPRHLLPNNVFDEITTCGTDPNLNQLWFGHKSGRISIYKCENEVSTRATKGRQNFVRGIRFSYNSAFRKITTKSTSNLHDVENDNIATTSSTRSTNNEPETQRYGNSKLVWSGPTVLLRHTDEVTSIRLSVEFKIAVSAGRDGIAVVWDLNDWSYIRTINRPIEIHHSPITLVTISPTMGDIVTVHTIPPVKQSPQSLNTSIDEASLSPAADECFEVTEENLDGFVNVVVNPSGKSILRLHTVNGRYVQHIAHEDRILAVCYSYIKEGVGVNVIATAIEGGIIRLWSSWNLSFVSEIVTGISNIKSITYSTHQHLVVLTKDFHIQVWETEGLYGSSPKFPQLAYK